MGRRTVSYEDALKRWLRDPEVKAEYDALEPAYQAARRRIEKELSGARPASLSIEHPRATEI